MSLLFSATLLISALLIFWLILRKIRRSEVTIADSTVLVFVCPELGAYGCV